MPHGAKFKDIGYKGWTVKNGTRGGTEAFEPGTFDSAVPLPSSGKPGRKNAVGGGSNGELEIRRGTDVEVGR